MAIFLRERRLDLLRYRSFNGSYMRFIPPVEGPLFDALCLYEVCIDENLQMLAGRGLAHAEFLSDGSAADSVFDQISVDLLGKVRRGVFKPIQHHPPAIVCQRSQRTRHVGFPALVRHIAMLLNPVPSCQA